MAKRKESKAAEEAVIEVQEVQGTSSFNLLDYQQYIVYGLAGIALLVAGWWMYKSFISEPKNKEAMSAMWQAQLQFERDSFQLALENPGGGFEGFLGIIDQYGGTKAGNLARYYAGVCHMQMGQYDLAIEQMERFKPSDDLLPIMKYGILGDLHSERKDMDKALSFYKKAVNAGNNDMLQAMYLKKLGLLYEYQGNKKEALAAFERYKRDFANSSSMEWRDIDKYIARNAE